MQTLKSPLRYPGGKSRAVKQILSYFPENITTVCSPFLGGGSIELALAQKGIKVYAYDNFKPLINFWQELLQHPKRLRNQVKGFYPLSKSQFYILQKNEKLPKEKQAAAFYALNRSSFSGVTFQGGMSPNHPRFTRKGIDSLATFKASCFHVAHMDFTQSISKHPDDFLYLDPPYYNAAQLYGNGNFSNKQFDHVQSATLLKTRTRWILSYNDCAYIRRLYKGHKIVKLHWSYGMNKNKQSSEILIFSIT